MPRTAVLFDLDGTLADTLAAIANALNRALAGLGLPRHPLDDVRRMVGEGVDVLCRKALPAGREAWQARLVERVRHEYQQDVLLDTRLYPGIAELLAELAAEGARLAVLSNKPDPLTVRTLEGLGIAGRFQCVVGARADLPHKPDPAGVRHILERLGVRPENALLVGDTAIDIETARAAGIEVVAVTWGFRSRDELAPHAPANLIEHPAEVLAIYRRRRVRTGANDGAPAP